MRGLQILCVWVTLGLIALVGAQALQSFDRYAADFRLLTLDSVKKELKVTQTQRDKMNRHADTHAATLNRLQKQFDGAKNKEAESKKIAPQIANANKKLSDSVLAELTPVQLRRLREISLQSVGPSALADMTIGKQAGLSEAQVRQIRKAIEAGAAQAEKIQQAAFQRVTQGMPKERPKDEKKAQELLKEGKRRSDQEAKRIAPQLERISKDTDAKILAVLTPQQRQTWTGPPEKSFKP